MTEELEKLLCQVTVPAGEHKKKNTIGSNPDQARKRYSLIYIWHRSGAKKAESVHITHWQIQTPEQNVGHARFSCNTYQYTLKWDWVPAGLG